MREDEIVVGFDVAILVSKGSEPGVFEGVGKGGVIEGLLRELLAEELKKPLDSKMKLSVEGVGAGAVAFDFDTELEPAFRELVATVDEVEDVRDTAASLVLLAAVREVGTAELEALPARVLVKVGVGALEVELRASGGTERETTVCVAAFFCAPAVEVS